MGSICVIMRWFCIHCKSYFMKNPSYVSIFHFHSIPIQSPWIYVCIASQDPATWCLYSPCYNISLTCDDLNWRVSMGTGTQVTQWINNNNNNSDNSNNNHFNNNNNVLKQTKIGQRTFLWLFSKKVWKTKLKLYIYMFQFYALILFLISL